MSRRLFILVLAITLPSCNSTELAPTQASTLPQPTNTAAQFEFTEKYDPSQTVLDFYYSITGDDIDKVMGFFHDDPTYSYQWLADDGITINTAEIHSLRSIEVFIREWMDLQVAVSIRDIEQEGDVVYFTLDGYSIEGEHFKHDGYAIVQNGKILRLHHDLIRILE